MKIYEVWFYDKNGSGLAYQGLDYQEAKKREKQVKEDIGQPPYFVNKVELQKHEYIKED